MKLLILAWFLTCSLPLTAGTEKQFLSQADVNQKVQKLKETTVAKYTPTRTNTPKVGSPTVTQTTTATATPLPSPTIDVKVTSSATPKAS